MLVQYIGRKAHKTDNVAGTGTVWVFGETQDVDPKAIPALARHPDVWRLCDGTTKPLTSDQIAALHRAPPPEPAAPAPPPPPPPPEMVEVAVFNIVDEKRPLVLMETATGLTHALDKLDNEGVVAWARSHGIDTAGQKKGAPMLAFVAERAIKQRRLEPKT